MSNKEHTDTYLAYAKISLFEIRKRLNAIEKAIDEGFFNEPYDAENLSSTLDLICDGIDEQMEYIEDGDTFGTQGWHYWAGTGG